MKIINTGLRSIIHEEGILEAGKEGEVSPSLAEKLLKLFEGELIAIKEVIAEAEVVATKEVKKAKAK